MGDFFFDLEKSVFSNLPQKRHTEAGDIQVAEASPCPAEELRWSLVQLLAVLAPRSILYLRPL